MLSAALKGQKSSYALVSQLSLEKLAVQAGNIGDRLTLRADSLASTGVGAVAEAQLVHLLHHGAGATGTLHLTLGKEGKLAHLGADKQHCRAIFAGCHAGTATDAGS